MKKALMLLLAALLTAMLPCGSALGAACYTMYGLHILRKLSLVKWDGEVRDYIEIHAMTESFDYGVDENGALIRLFDFDPSTIEYPSHG